MIRFASLGSGSRGNAVLIESGEMGSSTRILLDCGFSVAHILRRLAVLNISPASLDAILISHEHQDHVKGAEALAKRFKIPVWMTPGTRLALPGFSEEWIREFDPHRPFAIRSLEILPIPVPHDAREPVQFRLSDGNRNFVHLTDLGQITPYVARMVDCCDALMIECNHDLPRLRKGRYPPYLKRRIAGDYGHLCNETAAAFVGTLDMNRLRHVVAAHLSQENNHPELARAALAQALNATGDWITIADQWEGTEWLVV